MIAPALEKLIPGTTEISFYNDDIRCFPDSPFGVAFAPGVNVECMTVQYEVYNFYELIVLSTCLYILISLL